MNKPKVCISLIVNNDLLYNFIFKYYKDMQKRLSEAIDISLMATSHNCEQTSKMCQLNNFNYVGTSKMNNNQLHNTAVQLCKKHDPDCVIILNGNEIISDNLVVKYISYISGKPKSVAIKDVYVYNYEDQKFFNKKNVKFSVAKFFNKNLLLKTGYKICDDKKSTVDEFLESYELKTHKIFSSSKVGVVFRINKKDPEQEFKDTAFKAFDNYNSFIDKNISNVTTYLKDFNKDYLRSLNTELSVLLPVYKSKDILWIALESLCNQKGIEFNWELIVMEDEIEGETFGEEALMEYKDRLEDVRCMNIKYISHKKWIPLSLKWKKLAENTVDSSKVIFLQAADDYTHEDQLSTAYKYIVNEKYDVCQNSFGIFYHIEKDKFMTYDNFERRDKAESSLAMSFNREIFMNIPEGKVHKAVDSWLFAKMKSAIKRKLNIHHVGVECIGLYTDGLNNISNFRLNYYDKIQLPFRKLSFDVNEHVPDYIFKRLRSMEKKRHDIDIDEKAYEELGIPVEFPDGFVKIKRKKKRKIKRYY